VNGGNVKRLSFSGENSGRLRFSGDFSGRLKFCGDSHGCFVLASNNILVYTIYYVCNESLHASVLICMGNYMMSSHLADTSLQSAQLLH